MPTNQANACLPLYGEFLKPLKLDSIDVPVLVLDLIE
jgi:hypothetical protein